MLQVLNLESAATVMAGRLATLQGKLQAAHLREEGAAAKSEQLAALLDTASLVIMLTMFADRTAFYDPNTWCKFSVGNLVGTGTGCI